MWKALSLVFGLVSFCGAVSIPSYVPAWVQSVETEENVSRLVALTFVDAMTNRCSLTFPIIDLPDPLELPDVYITLPENSGYITLCHSIATGTSQIVDDLTFNLGLPATVRYVFDAPAFHVDGRHDVNFTLLGGLIEFISNEDYTFDLTNGHLDLSLEVRVYIDGNFDVLTADTEMLFTAIAINSTAFLNGEPFNWERFNAAIKELFDAAWPEIKPRVDAKIVELAAEIFQDCNIYTMIGGDFSCLQMRKQVIHEALLEEVANTFTSAEGICPPKPTPPPHDGSYFIYSENVTNFGSWAPEESRCPEGSFADGFHIKSEPYQGFPDDTAMNGLRLFCGGDNEVISREGSWGTWGYRYACANGGYINGFQLRSEAGGNLDDTAANNIRIFCSDSVDPIEADGTTFGAWQSVITCDEGFAVCGLKTQVQPDQSPLNDDTALNNIALLCCPL